MRSMAQLPPADVTVTRELRAGAALPVYHLRGWPTVGWRYWSTPHDSASLVHPSRSLWRPWRTCSLVEHPEPVVCFDGHEDATQLLADVRERRQSSVVTAAGPVTCISWP